jgi:imidazolonepropionase-like amidohydrolase
MSSAEWMVLRGGTVIDGTGAGPRKDSVILVKNDRIFEVADKGSFRLPEEPIRVFDTEGKFLLPGLIDAHTHVQDSGKESEASLLHEVLPYKALRAASHAQRTLEAGFTTVRDLGAELWLDVGLRDAIQDGIVKGPRMQVSGFKITSTGTDFPVFPPEVRVLGRETMDSPKEVRKAVRTLLAMGVDWIKVMTSGRTYRKSSSPDALGLTLEETRVAVEEAKNQGRKVSAHAHGNRGVKTALEAGCDSIEHGTVLDERDLEEMARRQIFLVPTLSYGKRLEKLGASSGLPSYVVEKALNSRRLRLQSFSRALSMGVKIALGSDSGMPFVYHGENAFELAAMVDAGMSSLQAIQAATKSAAELLGLSDQVGTLGAGKWADILVVEGNPLEDIAVLQNLANISAVFQAGNLMVDRGISSGNKALVR